MATHSSIFAWRIPEEEPGLLQSMESQKVGHNLASKQQQSDLPNIMNMSISWTSLVI